MTSYECEILLDGRKCPTLDGGMAHLILLRGPMASEGVRRRRLDEDGYAHAFAIFGDSSACDVNAFLLKMGADRFICNRMGGVFGCNQPAESAP